MYEFYPLIAVGAVISVFATVFTLAYAFMKDKKEAIGFDRDMKDSEIIRRLLKYAKPYVGWFAFVLFLMIFSIAHEIISPIIMGDIIEMVGTEGGFTLNDLYIRIAVYGIILAISLVCTYIQSIVLQKVGQKIVSNIREDLFQHIESLSHDQLNKIPVGTLVTRVTNDTNAISITFTNILVNLIKNMFIIVGVLAAMLFLNYMLTLVVLCFVPFVVIFTFIFRKFSRRAHRKVKDGTTNINIFLSENLSGMKIIQIFNREERKKSEFDEKNKKLGKAKTEQIFVFGIFRPMVYMLYISSVLCLFYFGARGKLEGWEFLGQIIEVNVIVAFYQYINKFFNPIQNLAEQFNRLQACFASAEKIYKIFDIVPEVVEAAREIGEKNGKHIPVIAGGGIYTGEDIVKFMALGADGVQMGTRFVATDECDASDIFKQSYVNAKREDIEIIQSPVGMPGRAIRNSFLDKVKEGLARPKACPFDCIKTCNVETSPYCIMLALYNAFRGKMSHGYAFCGSNAWRVDRIMSVKELFSTLKTEFEERCKR